MSLISQYLIGIKFEVAVFNVQNEASGAKVDRHPIPTAKIDKELGNGKLKKIVGGADAGLFRVESFETSADKMKRTNKTLFSLHQRTQL